MIIKHKAFGSMANNAFLIVDEKTNTSALVDCPCANDDMLSLIGDTELRYILLTHGHYDHIGGVDEIKQRYSASVVISQPDESMLGSSRLSLAAFVGAHHRSTQADIIVSDGDIISLGDIDISVISTPGHTMGSVCYLAGDALFTGDTLFRLSCGRTDFPSGSSKEMAASLRKLASLEGDYNVYTGHEALSTLDYERANNPYLKQL